MIRLIFITIFLFALLVWAFTGFKMIEPYRWHTNYPAASGDEWPYIDGVL